MEGKNSITFDESLNDERQYYLLNALRRMKSQYR